MVDWQDVLDNPNAQTAFTEHLAPLGTSDEHKEMLAQVAKQVESVRLSEGQLIWRVRSKDGAHDLICSPPAEAADTAIYGLSEVVSLHNTITLCMDDDPDDVWFSTSGVDQSGKPYAHDNFVADAEGCIPVIAYDCCEEFVLLNPTEGAFGDWSHEDEKLKEVPAWKSLGYNGILLSLLCHCLLGEPRFPPPTK